MKAVKPPKGPVGDFLGAVEIRSREKMKKLLADNCSLRHLNADGWAFEGADEVADLFMDEKRASFSENMIVPPESSIVGVSERGPVTLVAHIAAEDAVEPDEIGYLVKSFKVSEGKVSEIVYSGRFLDEALEFSSSDIAETMDAHFDALGGDR